MAEVDNNFVDIQITGGMPGTCVNGFKDVDLILFDADGERYAMNVMTQDRFTKALEEQIDMGYDTDAPSVLVLNEDCITLDALNSLLLAHDKSSFEPWVYKLQEENDHVL